MNKFNFLTFILAAIFAFPAVCDNLAEFRGLLAENKPNFRLLYRYEYLEDDAFDKIGKASTARANLEYITPKYNNLQLGGEVEAVLRLGAQDYNDLKSAGKQDYPIIPDTQQVRAKQGWVSYDFGETMAKYGRQYINLDDERFIGSNKWRRTYYDGVYVQSQLLPHIRGIYAYVYNVDTVFGKGSEFNNFRGENHIANVSFTNLPFSQFQVFGYYFDNDTLQELSSQTYGLNLNGRLPFKKLPVNFKVVYANQRDAGDNPARYKAHYAHLMLGSVLKGVNVDIGAELLGSDKGKNAVTTPYSSSHEFNGWADQFILTPKDGLRDYYFRVNHRLRGIHSAINGTNILAKIHYFEADNGGDHYGNEFNIGIDRNCFDAFDISLQYSYFDAKDRFEDVHRVAFMVDFSF